MGRKRLLKGSVVSAWNHKTPRRHRLLFAEPLESRSLLAALGGPFAGDGPGLTIDPDSYRDSSFLVQFRAGPCSVSASAGFEFAGTTLGAEWAVAPGLRQVHLDPGTTLAEALAAYQNNPNVLYAEPDYRVSLQLVPEDPGDPQFGALYGLHNIGQAGGTPDADIDAPEAWDITTGSPSVVVAVIDTGVDYNHEDLRDNMWVNEDEASGDPGVDDDDNGYIDDIHGYNFADNNGDPLDDHFHGTHVAGTIGAVGNNGVGIVGVNWNVKIMALKFLDAGGGGFTSDAIAAVNYAVANGASVSNNSWGGGGFSQGLFNAIQNARNQGHIFVAAAGNDGWSNDIDDFYPANYGLENIISVAATDNDDALAWFSNYGKETVDLAAPGAGIYSTFPSFLTDAIRDGGYSVGYETISGTSMATPHVTGVIALVQSLHLGDPEWSYERVIEQVLGTVDIIDGAELTVTGGRLNAAAAVGNAPPDALGPRIIGTNPAGSVSGTVGQVRLQFSESIDPATIGMDDIISISGPEGAIDVLAVVAVVGTSRQFDVTFAPQTVLGDYSVVVGPNISDLTGNLLDQDRDGLGGEDPDDVFTATFAISDIIGFPSDDVPAPIPFAGGVGSFLTIDQDIAISDLNVQVDIWFPYDGDLHIQLESPNGTVVDLSVFNGGFDSDFADTIFDDEADTPIRFGFGPFAGAYQPDGFLSDFDGENAAGTWTLWIYNWINSLELDSEGWLDAWSLQIEGNGSGDPPPPPPPPPPGNRAPVAQSDTLQGERNTALAFTADDLLANDTDPDGDTLQITFWGDPTSGNLNVRPDGLITFTPEDEFEGEVSFQYLVSDGSLTATGNVTIDVQPPPPTGNRRPTAGPDTLQGQKDSAIAFTATDLLVNDTDPDGDPLEITFWGAPSSGTLNVRPDGLITFTPDDEFTGQVNFQYIVSDGFLSDTGSVVIDVQPFLQWHNSDQRQDVNADGNVSSIDALLIVNYLNKYGDPTPPIEFVLASSDSTNYYDVSGDNYFTAIDLLIVFNYMNSQVPGQSLQSSAGSTPGDTASLLSATAEVDAEESFSASASVTIDCTADSPDEPVTLPRLRDLLPRLPDLGSPAGPRRLLDAAVDQLLDSDALADLLDGLDFSIGFRRNRP